MNDEIFMRRIDEVLHYLWDPCGACDVPEARDEYRQYVPEVVRLAHLNDRKGIEEYLYKTATVTMGNLPNRERDQAMAGIIMEWKQLLSEES